MELTRDGKRALHALPAGGHLRAELRERRSVQGVFEKYRIPTYREASQKPFVIAAMILLSRVRHARGRGQRPGRREDKPMTSQIIRRPNPEVMRRTARRCRERGIVIPTFRQLRDPGLDSRVGKGPAAASLAERDRSRRIFSASPGRTTRFRASSEASTSSRSRGKSPASKPGSSASPAASSPPGPTRWGRPSAASFRGS